jgi:hypothetical protein
MYVRYITYVSGPGRDSVYIPTSAADRCSCGMVHRAIIFPWLTLVLCQRSANPLSEQARRPGCNLTSIKSKIKSGPFETNEDENEMTPPLINKEAEYDRDAFVHTC